MNQSTEVKERVFKGADGRNQKGKKEVIGRKPGLQGMFSIPFNEFHQLSILAILIYTPGVNIFKC